MGRTPDEAWADAAFKQLIAKVHLNSERCTRSIFATARVRCCPVYVTTREALRPVAARPERLEATGFEHFSTPGSQAHPSLRIRSSLAFFSKPCSRTCLPMVPEALHRRDGPASRRTTSSETSARSCRRRWKHRLLSPGATGRCQPTALTPYQTGRCLQKHPVTAELCDGIVPLTQL